MTYEYFITQNKMSKGFFPHLMRIVEVDFKNNTCKVNFEGNISVVSINSVVEDVIYNGMGALSNPSKFKGWSGFEK